MPNEFYVELGKAGPWALVSGFLLWVIIQAWTSDRKTVTVLLGEFRTSIDKLTNEIHTLGGIQTEILKTLDK